MRLIIYPILGILGVFLNSIIDIPNTIFSYAFYPFLSFVCIMTFMYPVFVREDLKGIDWFRKTKFYENRYSCVKLEELIPTLYKFNKFVPTKVIDSFKNSIYESYKKNRIKFFVSLALGICSIFFFITFVKSSININYNSESIMILILIQLVIFINQISYLYFKWCQDIDKSLLDLKKMVDELQLSDDRRITAYRLTKVFKKAT